MSLPCVLYDCSQRRARCQREYFRRDKLAREGAPRLLFTGGLRWQIAIQESPRLMGAPRFLLGLSPFSWRQSGGVGF